MPTLPLEDKARKLLPMFTFLTEYFPDVIVELTELCVQGNRQHNPELDPANIMWAREKSTDQLNTAFRHMFDRGTGTHYDKDGQPHLIKSIWRLCAQRQLDKEAERRAADGGAGAGGLVFSPETGDTTEVAPRRVPSDPVKDVLNRIYPPPPDQVHP